MHVCTQIKHPCSLSPQAWPELPFLELVLQGRSGASWELQCRLLRGWRALEAALPAAFSSDFSRVLPPESQGVMFVLTSHASELPVLNSPWCAQGSPSRIHTPPSSPSSLSPSPRTTTSIETQTSPILFTPTLSAHPTESHLQTASATALPLAATSAAEYLLSVPPGARHGAWKSHCEVWDGASGRAA